MCTDSQTHPCQRWVGITESKQWAVALGLFDDNMFSF